MQTRTHVPVLLERGPLDVGLDVLAGLVDHLHDVLEVQVGLLQRGAAVFVVCACVRVCLCVRVYVCTVCVHDCG